MTVCPDDIPTSKTLGDLLLPWYVPGGWLFITNGPNKVLDGLPIHFVFGDGVHLEVPLECSAVRAV